MYNLNIQTDLSMSHSQENTELGRLILGSIKRKKGVPASEVMADGIYWGPSLFSLDTCAFYRALPPTLAHDVLKRCNDFFLSDFYYLEKAGMAYCARMTLLGESTEIRQMYSLIGADEATHLTWFLPYIPPALRTHSPSQMMYLFCDVINECDTNTLYYLVQTIIEGWGVANYTMLAKHCRSVGLQGVLREIMEDEMLHHKTGQVLFEANKVDSVTAMQIQDRLRAYAETLRVGPQLIVHAFEQACGVLPIGTIENLFSELRSEVLSYSKLKLFKRLITQPGTEKFVAALEEQGCFTPYTSAACAKMYKQIT